MGKLYDEIDGRLARFLLAQRLFFVATAPLEGGHVNVSPKGATDATFRILGPRTVSYLDLTGSGVETLAHLRENGRICLMFCAFEGSPKIVRLHGRGKAIGLQDAAFATDLVPFEPLVSGSGPGSGRSSVSSATASPTPAATACSLYEYLGERDTMTRWIERKGKDGIVAYHAERNAASVDGLPGAAPVPVPPS